MEYLIPENRDYLSRKSSSFTLYKNIMDMIDLIAREEGENVRFYIFYEYR